jgi:hypothetical protein
MRTAKQPLPRATLVLCPALRPVASRATLGPLTKRPHGRVCLKLDRLCYKLSRVCC